MISTNGGFETRQEVYILVTGLNDTGTESFIHNRGHKTQGRSIFSESQDRSQKSGCPFPPAWRVSEEFTVASD